MRDQCTKYSETVKSFSSPQDCESDLIIAIKLIEEATGIKTVPAKKLVKCEIADKLTLKPFMKIDSIKEVLEVTLDDFRRIGGLKKNGTEYFAAYHPKTGRIFLVKDKWCFSNLIHEVLHSRSAFSKEEFPPDNLQFVSEGMTEFLVGIVLKRKIPRCYEEWRKTDSCFLLSYMEYVKPWYYLSKKIDFAQIVSIYFDVKEPCPSKILGKTLQQLVGGTFEDVFGDAHIKERGLFQIFKDELGEVYPENFAEFQGSVIEELNLDHL